LSATSYGADRTNNVATDPRCFIQLSGLSPNDTIFFSNSQSFFASDSASASTCETVRDLALLISSTTNQITHLAVAGTASFASSGSDALLVVYSVNSTDSKNLSLSLMYSRLITSNTTAATDLASAVAFNERCGVVYLGGAYSADFLEGNRFVGGSSDAFVTAFELASGIRSVFSFLFRSVHSIFYS
jgi:hypothetical protein